MDEVVKFLEENPVFYIATVDGDVPKVRPFGFFLKHQQKLFFGVGFKNRGASKSIHGGAVWYNMELLI